MHRILVRDSDSVERFDNARGQRYPVVMDVFFVCRADFRRSKQENGGRSRRMESLSILHPQESILEVPRVYPGVRKFCSKRYTKFESDT